MSLISHREGGSRERVVKETGRIIELLTNLTNSTNLRVLREVDELPHQCFSRVSLSHKTTNKLAEQNNVS